MIAPPPVELLEAPLFLHCVATGDLAEAERMLTDQPALLSSRSASGATALHLAAAKGLASMASLLLQHGAEMRAREPVLQR